MAEVLLEPGANEKLESMQPDIRDRIKGKLRDAGEKPEHYLERLSGRDMYKVKMGSYRAEVDWDKQAGQLLVMDVGHRDGFYD